MHHFRFLVVSIFLFSLSRSSYGFCSLDNELSRAMELGIVMISFSFILYFSFYEIFLFSKLLLERLLPSHPIDGYLEVKEYFLFSENYVKVFKKFSLAKNMKIQYFIKAHTKNSIFLNFEKNYKKISMINILFDAV